MPVPRVAPLAFLTSHRPSRRPKDLEESWGLVYVDIGPHREECQFHVHLSFFFGFHALRDFLGCRSGQWALMMLMVGQPLSPSQDGPSLYHDFP